MNSLKPSMMKLLFSFLIIFPFTIYAADNTNISPTNTKMSNQWGGCTGTVFQTPAGMFFPKGNQASAGAGYSYYLPDGTVANLKDAHNIPEWIPITGSSGWSYLSVGNYETGAEGGYLGSSTLQKCVPTRVKNGDIVTVTKIMTHNGFGLTNCSGNLTITPSMAVAGAIVVVDCCLPDNAVYRRSTSGQRFNYAGTIVNQQCGSPN
jgi:hypothetical protein